MKISTLISTLADMISQCGDVPIKVCLVGNNDDYILEITTDVDVKCGIGYINIEIEEDALIKRLKI